jgi:hypothetical protein
MVYQPKDRFLVGKIANVGKEIFVKDIGIGRIGT